MCVSNSQKTVQPNMPMLTKNRFFNRNHCGRNAVDDDPVAMRASGKFTLRQIKDAITRVFMGKPVDKAVMTMDTDVRWALFEDGLIV